MIKLNMYVYFFFQRGLSVSPYSEKVPYDLKRVGSDYSNPFTMIMREHISPAVVVGRMYTPLWLTKMMQFENFL